MGNKGCVYINEHELPKMNLYSFQKLEVIEECIHTHTGREKSTLFKLSAQAIADDISYLRIHFGRKSVLTHCLRYERLLN